MRFYATLSGQYRLRNKKILLEPSKRIWKIFFLTKPSVQLQLIVKTEPTRYYSCTDEDQLDRNKVLQRTDYT